MSGTESPEGNKSYNPKSLEEDGTSRHRMLASHRVIQCSNEKTSKDMNGNESKGSVRSGPEECATRRGSCKGQSILLYATVLIPSLW